LVNRFLRRSFSARVCKSSDTNDETPDLLDDPSQVFHASVQDLQRPPGNPSFCGYGLMDLLLM
jgi:hypothetical protein